MTRSARKRPRKNPFQFGRALSAEELVDRDGELQQILRAMENLERLFVIGPRRYGKTSLLHAAEEEAESRGVVVLRYDAERYESLDLLAQAILNGATRRLADTIERAGEAIKRLAGHLKPELGYNVEANEFTVRLGRPENANRELPLFTDALDVVEKMARESGRPVSVVIDEIQQIIEMHGEPAEKQLRSVVQRHRHVGYIFAGSKTRLLADLTGAPHRAFYRLGARLFVGPIPREEFAAFLAKGFRDSAFTTDPAALERILDIAQDVPYTVQRLAHQCWETTRVAPGEVLTEARVEKATKHLLQQEDPAHTQVWNSLTKQQKRALKAVIMEEGAALLSSEVSHRYRVPTGSMQRALGALEKRQIIRIEQRDGSTRYRLEDPLFGAWLIWAQGDES